MSARRVRASLGVRGAALGVVCLALTCSLAQAGRFLMSAGVDDVQRWVLGGVAAAIIIGSPILARLAGMMLAARASAALVALALVVVLASETFSIGTSAVSMTSSLLDAERRENEASPQAQQARQQADAYMRQAMSLQTRADELPRGYASRAMSIQRDASEAMRQATQAQWRADEVRTSRTGAAMASIEQVTGIGTGGLALMGAVLLSLVPFSIMLSLGVLAEAGQGREKPAQGKPKRPPSGAQ